MSVSLTNSQVLFSVAVVFVYFYSVFFSWFKTLNCAVFSNTAVFEWKSEKFPKFFVTVGCPRLMWICFFSADYIKLCTFSNNADLLALWRWHFWWNHADFQNKRIQIARGWLQWSPHVLIWIFRPIVVVVLSWRTLPYWLTPPPHWLTSPPQPDPPLATWLFRTSGCCGAVNTF